MRYTQKRQYLWFIWGQNLGKSLATSSGASANSNLVTFTEEILTGKLDFLCSEFSLSQITFFEELQIWCVIETKLIGTNKNKESKSNKVFGNRSNRLFRAQIRGDNYIQKQLSGGVLQKRCS